MQPICFGVIGGGWRSEFYLRIAEALPERFQAAGVVIRNEEKRKVFSQRWGVPVFADTESMLAESNSSFLVVCVAKTAVAEVTAELVERGVPVLAETPPAPDLEQLRELYRSVGGSGGGAMVQIAEQYHLQPMHAARLSIATSGKLGAVSQAHVSAAHGYHGISLIRRHLGIGFENAVIRSERFESPLTAGPGRQGPPQEEKVVPSVRTLATLRFGDRWGVYDFTGDQYFSWIRSSSVVVRGDRGEIRDRSVSWLTDFRTPVRLDLRREQAGEDGNLEGFGLKGILAGDEWVYRNPFLPARLSDEEIAIACCLERMHEYTQGGPSFYSLEEAMQDQYLALLVDEAAISGDTIRSETQIWAGESINRHK